ncbi:MAG: squalene--hopene cyclase, partial [Planctomycetales bacterium]|nr:squalene--hopene cyclase [Planctomycetales bacterium]
MNSARLSAATHKVIQELRDARSSHGPWVGELASSAVSTATAVSALACSRRALAGDARVDQFAPLELIRSGVNWLLRCQRSDGGWGDTDLSFSNVATTYLVCSALTLALQVDAELAELEPEIRARNARGLAYLSEMGGIAAVRRRYGKDKTFAVPILTNAALAGLVPWSEVSALPFELAVPPQRFYRFLRMPVVSYAVPALVAIGQAVYHFRPPRNPLLRWLRRRAIFPSRRVLGRMQPESGGYLEAIPLTSFVVMSLASIGAGSHPVTAAGLRFLQQTARPDGSWPIDSNLATWNTSLAIHAIGGQGLSDAERAQLISWLLQCQHTQVHPFTGAAPG